MADQKAKQPVRIIYPTGPIKESDLPPIPERLKRRRVSFFERVKWAFQAVKLILWR